MKKTQYIKPEVIKIVLDNTISLQMQSPPNDPTPTGGGKGSSKEPFQSPFGDKPFN